MIFIILGVAKFLKIGQTNFSWFSLIIFAAIFYIITGFITWLSKPETAKKVAERSYYNKLKKANKKAEKEAQKIIDEARKN